MSMDGEAILKPRETRTVSFEIDDDDSVNYNVRGEIAHNFVFTRFASDQFSTVNEVRFKKA